MTHDTEKGAGKGAALQARRADLDRTIAFLQGIGLEIEIVPGAKGFIKGVRIVQGRLLVDPSAKPSNLLHEAGHLSVLPARFRAQANDDLDVVTLSMLEEVDFSDPDAPEARAAMQCGDTEATAWAWAAGLAIGLDPEVIITNREYDGQGASIRLFLELNSYVGINGLACAKWCALRPGRHADRNNLPAFPQLKFWLQS